MSMIAVWWSADLLTAEIRADRSITDSHPCGGDAGEITAILHQLCAAEPPQITNTRMKLNLNTSSPEIDLDSQGWQDKKLRSQIKITEINIT